MKLGVLYFTEEVSVKKRFFIVSLLLMIYGMLVPSEASLEKQNVQDTDVQKKIKDIISFSNPDPLSDVIPVYHHLLIPVVIPTSNPLEIPVIKPIPNPHIKNLLIGYGPLGEVVSFGEATIQPFDPIKEVFALAMRLTVFLRTKVALSPNLTCKRYLYNEVLPTSTVYSVLDNIVLILTEMSMTDVLRHTVSVEPADLEFFQEALQDISPDKWKDYDAYMNDLTRDMTPEDIQEMRVELESISESWFACLENNQ